MDFIAGEVLYFNKPLTWTSFDLVNKFRYKLSRKLKVKKIKVGHAGTLDPLATGLNSFVGTIQQIPPVFSACKVDGKRAYELARKGEEVELKSKTLVIDEMELLECNLPVIKIRVVCSKGTYIRALARDIGVALNSGAHLIGLERTRIGDITLDKCMNPEDIDAFLDEAIGDRVADEAGAVPSDK